MWQEDEKGRKVGAEGAKHLRGGARCSKPIIPAAEKRPAAGDQHGKRQDEEEDPERPHLAGIPVNNLLGGLGQPVTVRKAPKNEGGHKEESREHKQNLRSGEDALIGVHNGHNNIK